MDTDLAESVGFLYDARDHTYFFDITERFVVDAGLLGMKTKFCNFVLKGAEQENTVSREVNVRGCPHIALVATRRIEPGEELCFDYMFGKVRTRLATTRSRKVDLQRSNQPLTISQSHWLAISLSFSSIGNTVVGSEARWREI